jgi:hypothetical protein
MSSHSIELKQFSLPVCVDWFDLWEKPFGDGESPFVPVSCAMLTGERIFELAGIVSNVMSFNWVEEAIDIQPATKLAAIYQERLALKLDVMLKSVFPTSSTQFF